MRSHRLLLISERLPKRDESGGSARLFALLGILARAHRIDLWVERDERFGYGAVTSARLHRAETGLTNLGVRVLPRGWRALVSALKHTTYDEVIFEFFFTAARYGALVRAFQPDAPHVVDSVDVYFGRLASAAQRGLVGSWAVSRARARELAAYSKADAVIVASDEDQALLGGEGIERSWLIPVIVDAKPRRALSRSSEVFFVAHFDHAPNADGIQWFARDIWPRIRSPLPAAKLTIVGDPTSEIRELCHDAGIVLEGRVDDLQPYYDRAALAIAPLRYGGGMKAKVVEAMAAGVPVVSTVVGAQGLHATNGEHLLIADTPELFSEAVLALLRDPDRAARVGLAGQHHIGAICGSSAVEPIVNAMLMALEGGRKGRDARVRHSLTTRALRVTRTARFAAGHTAVQWLRRYRRMLFLTFEPSTPDAPRTAVDAPHR